jgi:TPR repeat protein
MTYENGHGVNQDHTKTVKWIRKSAAQGNKYAQLRLGLMYRNGDGVERNCNKTVE